MTNNMTSDWLTRASLFKKKLAAKIPTQWTQLSPEIREAQNFIDAVTKSSILTETELQILQLDAVDLIAAISRKEYTSVEVTVAYTKAAGIAQQLVNCLVDFFFEEALERAAWLDKELDRTGKTVGSMHGLPISLKGETPLRPPFRGLIALQIYVE
jgi:amidase